MSRALAYIEAVGARTATGIDALTAATTLRARKSFVRETRFVDQKGEPIALSLVQSVPDDLIGRERFVELAVPALIEAAGTPRKPIPLILAVPAEADPMDPRGARLLQMLADRSRVPIDIARSKIVAQGRAGGVSAIEQALARLDQDDPILVGGVDSYFDPERLEPLDRDRRLHGPETENGFIPGEGSAFLRLTKRGEDRMASILGIATEREPRPYGSPDPSLALGLSLAATRALEPLVAAREKVGWALTDVVGERHRIEDWLYASGRVQAASFESDLVDESPLLLTGDLGAASAPLLVVLATMGWRIGARRMPRVIIAASSDAAERGVIVLGHEGAA